MDRMAGLARAAARVHPTLTGSLARAVTALIRTTDRHARRHIFETIPQPIRPEAAPRPSGPTPGASGPSASPGPTRRCAASPWTQPGSSAPPGAPTSTMGRWSASSGTSAGDSPTSPPASSAPNFAQHASATDQPTPRHQRGIPRTSVRCAITAPAKTARANRDSGAPSAGTSAKHRAAVRRSWEATPKRQAGGGNPARAPKANSGTAGGRQRDPGLRPTSPSERNLQPGVTAGSQGGAPEAATHLENDARASYC